MYKSTWALAALAAAACVSLRGGELRIKGAAAWPMVGTLQQEGLPDPGRRLIAGWSRVILQYWRSPGAAELEGIGEIGGTVLGPMPDDGLLVLFPDGARVERLSGSPRVVQMAPEWKVSELIGAGFQGRMMVEFFPDVTAKQALTIVARSGLVAEEPGLVIRGGQAAARALAEWNEVAYVFPAADATGPACTRSGLSGLTAGRMGQYVASSGASWSPVPEAGAVVGYFVETVPEKLAGMDVEGALARVLREWERFTLLRFEKAASRLAERTVSLRIAAGDHGDAWPFDGAGRVLAHAFYPSPLFREPMAGDMHVDLDEEWTQEDLYSVMLHELGHALGLAHSDDPTSVMYPMYRRARGLGAVDIAMIRGMYGVRKPVEEEDAPEIGLEISEVTRREGESVLSFAGRAWGEGVRIRWRYTNRGNWNAAMGAFDWIAPVVPMFTPEDEVVVEAYDSKGGVAQRRFRPTRFPEMLE